MDANVMILAGGRGIRLRSVVSDRPKPLAEVNGRPFLSYLFDQLLAAGFSGAILCTGHRGEQIRAAFGPNYNGLCLEYSEEPVPLGTGGALRFALPRAKNELVLVMNGDSYYQVDFAGLRRHFHLRSASAMLSVTWLADARRFGSLHLDEADRVVSFNEKDTRIAAGWINAGVYLITRRMLNRISPERPVSLERDCFPAWVGDAFYGCRGSGRFLDIGTPESYGAAAEFFGSQRLEGP